MRYRHGAAAHRIRCVKPPGKATFLSQCRRARSSENAMAGRQAGVPG